MSPFPPITLPCPTHPHVPLSNPPPSLNMVLAWSYFQVLSFVPPKSSFPGPLSLLGKRAAALLVSPLHVALVQLSIHGPWPPSSHCWTQNGVTNPGHKDLSKRWTRRIQVDRGPSLESSGWRWKAGFSKFEILEGLCLELLGAIFSYMWREIL